MDLARLLIALTAGEGWRSRQRLPRLSTDPLPGPSAAAVVVSGTVDDAVLERPGLDRADGLILPVAHQLARMTQHPLPDVLTALRAVDGAPVST